MKLVNKYTYLNQATIDYINELVTDLTDFDEDKFSSWLDEKDIKGKNNPSNYLKACFKKELENGRFTKEETVEYIPATTPLFTEMRRLGITVTPESTGAITTTITYLLNHQIVTPEELKELNHAIVNYLKEQKDKLTSDYYVELMRKSKLLSGRLIDWVEIGKEITKFNEEWEQMLKELSSEEE